MNSIDKYSSVWIGIILVVFVPWGYGILGWNESVSLVLWTGNFWISLFKHIMIWFDLTIAVQPTTCSRYFGIVKELLDLHTFSINILYSCLNVDEGKFIIRKHEFSFLVCVLESNDLNAFSKNFVESHQVGVSIVMFSDLCVVIKLTFNLFQVRLSVPDGNLRQRVHSQFHLRCYTREGKQTRSNKPYFCSVR